MKISLHSGHNMSMEHNRREPGRTGDHIDVSRIKDNVTLVDRKLEDLYEEKFGAAIQEYNATQSRKDRKIKNYLKQIKRDGVRKPCYEIICQVGDAKTQPERELAKKAMLQFAEEFMERNKDHVAIAGIFLHMDEATPHMHIDYVPVATGYTNGPKVQNSLSRALEQQTKTKSESIHQTVQMMWQNREREAFRDVCIANGIEVDEIEHGVGRKHLSTPLFKQSMKEADELIQAADDYKKEQYALAQKEKAEIIKEAKQEAAKLLSETHQRERVRRLDERERKMENKENSILSREQTMDAKENAIKEKEALMKEMEERAKSNMAQSLATLKGAEYFAQQLQDIKRRDDFLKTHNLDDGAVAYDRFMDILKMETSDKKDEIEKEEKELLDKGILPSSR